MPQKASAPPGTHHRPWYVFDAVNGARNVGCDVGQLGAAQRPHAKAGPRARLMVERTGVRGRCAGRVPKSSVALLAHAPYSNFPAMGSPSAEAGGANT